MNFTSLGKFSLQREEVGVLIYFEVLFSPRVRFTREEGVKPQFFYPECNLLFMTCVCYSYTLVLY